MPETVSEEQLEDVAFEQGFEAREKGLGLTTNPHPPTTVSYQSWKAGWTDSDQGKPSVRKESKP